MTQDAAWPRDMTRATGQEVRRYRQGRMSAEQLAAAVSTLGLPYTRSQVTNLEAGRRTSISIGEILALAYVLAVPPLRLIFPIGRVDDTTVLPGVQLDTWAAAQWLTGEGPPPVRNSPDAMARWRANADLLELYREHVEAVSAWKRQTRVPEGSTRDEVAGLLERASERRREIERNLHLVRRAIRDRGELPPLLPAELAALDDDEPEPRLQPPGPAPEPTDEARVEAAIAERRRRKSTTAKGTASDESGEGERHGDDA